MLYANYTRLKKRIATSFPLFATVPYYTLLILRKISLNTAIFKMIGRPDHEWYAGFPVFHSFSTGPVSWFSRAGRFPECTPLCMHVRMYLCVRASACGCACAGACVCACACVRVLVCVRVRVPARVNVCVYVYACVCVYVYMIFFS